MEEIFFELLSRLVGREVVRKKQTIRSPFRDDNRPSFSIYQHNGTWFFKDFGTGETGTAVHLFAKMTGLSYKEAIKMLELGNKIDCKNINVKNYNNNTSEYSTSEFACVFEDKGYKGSYFDKIGIIEEICRLNCISFGKFIAKNFSYDNAVRYEIESIRKEISKSEKYYFPENKTTRFLGNRKWHHLFGMNSIEAFRDKSFCFIAAGEKDACVLQQVFQAPAIALNSETYIPNADMLEYIRNIEKKMVIVYDNDKTGKEYTIKLFNLLNDANIPVAYRYVEHCYKDVTDMFIAEKGVKLLKS